MAHYTVLNTNDLSSILAQYGVEGLLSSAVLSGGSENTNYLVKGSNWAYVLTICEQKSKEKASELVKLLEHINNHGLATSKPIRTQAGELISVWEDKPIILKEFIEGDILEDLPATLLVDLGNDLGRLHQIASPKYLPHAVSYGLERFDEVQLYAPHSSFYQWLKKTQQYIEEHINSELPKSLIHSDIFYNNIIVDSVNGKATIMDYEEACNYFRVFDVGMMIIGTCSQETEINLEKAAHILTGYQQQIQLQDTEKAALQAFTVYAATATAFWRHQNFNYVQVDPSMKNHHQAMQKLADAVKGIPEETFQNMLF